MSSKTIHSLAGLLVGVGVIAAAHPTLAQGALIMVGTHLGASAPDWLEVPVWTTHFRWFAPSTRVRHSLIPHRTITHTVSLWAVAFAAAAYFALTTQNALLPPLVLGFCSAVASHLALDIRTPMGIPIWPFGARYRLQGVRCAPAMPSHHQS